MALIYCDGDNDLAKSYSRAAAEALVSCYPNHSWWVETKGGALVIKHFGISGMLGMVRHTSSLDFSATNFKKEVILAAGELLERAGLSRGAYTGEAVQAFEGDDLTEHWVKNPGMKMKVIH